MKIILDNKRDIIYYLNSIPARPLFRIIGASPNVAGFFWYKMKYNKPHLTFEQQADFLISMGLIGDKNVLANRLEVVNYYRLDSYLYPFRLPDNTYKTDTTFDKVWRRYTFDRQFRLIVLDAVERVEIALKTQISYNFSHNYGSFGHLNKNNFDSSIPVEDHNLFVAELKLKATLSKEVIIDNFKINYDEFPNLPLLIAAEIMSFSNIFTLYRSMKNYDKRNISYRYDVSGKILESWIKCLNYVRNICAHHSRLWNRELALRPLIPDYKNHPEWYIPEPINNKKIFVVLSILSYLISFIAPQSKWKERLKSLLNEYNDIPLNEMGFAEKWTDYTFWK